MRTARGSSRPRGGGSASVHAGIHNPPRYGPGDSPGCGPGNPLVVGLETPQVWAWRTLQVWVWRSPWPDPSASPPGCGPGDLPHARHGGIPSPMGTCKACWGTTCNACWDTTPCEQNSWHTFLKILPCPKLRLRAVISTGIRVMTHCVKVKFFFFYFVSSMNSWVNCRCESPLTLNSIAIELVTADIAKSLFTLNVNVNFAVILHLTLTWCPWWCWRWHRCKVDGHRTRYIFENADADVDA